MRSRNELLSALMDATKGWLPTVGDVYTITLDPEEREILMQALRSAPTEAVRSEDSLPCIFCHGTGRFEVSPEQRVLAEKAVEASMNDTRTRGEKIMDGVKFILGPEADHVLVGCHCSPGRCMAPNIMGRQQPCLDPAKAAMGRTDMNNSTEGKT